MSSRDYEEFLESLNAREVRYLVIGAHAVAFYAQPRATKDLDILIAPDRENGKLVLRAITDLPGTDLGLTVEDLIEADSVVQLGVSPARIDLMAALSLDLDFKTAWANRVEGRFGDVPTQYLSRDDLVAEKEHTGRDQDRVDAKLLRMAQGLPPHE